MTLRLRRWLLDNVVVQVFRDALDGHVLAGFAVTSLLGTGLIVVWSFALVSTNELLRASFPPSTHTGLDVRATDAVRISGDPSPNDSPRAAPEHCTEATESAPSHPVDATLRRDGDLADCLPASTRGRGSHAGPASPRPAARSKSGGSQWAGSLQGSDGLRRIVASAAFDHGIPAHILAGLVEDESSWSPAATGKNGEVGLLQLKQGTAAWCGIKDRRRPEQNADCGARYLAAQFAAFGTWELALVAFKAGPAAIPENIPAASWAYAQRALLRAEAYR